VSDSPNSTHLVRVSKRQARALEKAEFISYLSGADLSDARRYFELARYSTRQHDKGELMAGVVVGILVAALIGGGSWLVTVLTALGAFGATLVVIFLIHWLRAPSAFHKQAQTDLKSARLLLEEEKERHKKAILVGRIICISTEERLNTYIETLNPTVEHDYVITINLSVTNDSAVAAMATRFELTVNGYGATELPADKCSVKRKFKIPGGPPHHVEWQSLTPFPLNVEITNTSHQTGWLRFLVGLIRGLHVDHASGIRLTVFDHRNEPHVIYEGPIGQTPDCGTVVEHEAPGPSAEWD
jgi:hypothetical protein